MAADGQVRYILQKQIVSVKNINYRTNSLSETNTPSQHPSNHPPETKKKKHPLVNRSKAQKNVFCPGFRPCKCVFSISIYSVYDHVSWKSSVFAVFYDHIIIYVCVVHENSWKNHFPHGDLSGKKKKTRLMQLKHAITIGVQLLEYLTFWGFLWDFLENDVIDAVLYHET